MATINAVADFFILRADSDSDSGDFMTHLKLQKLVYYAQAWHLALHKKPLFDDVFQAWAHGPVCPTLWNRFKDYGSNPISSDTVKTNPSNINKIEKELLEEVWCVYGQFTAKRLEEMTHSEEPWLDARGDIPEYQTCKKVITKTSMRSFYSKKLNK